MAEMVVDTKENVYKEQIVRCKECRHWWVDGDNMLCHIHYDPTVPEHFCSYGQKKESE